MSQELSIFDAPQRSAAGHGPQRRTPCNPDFAAPAAGSFAAMTGLDSEALGPPTEELRLVSVEVCPPITRLAAQGSFNRKTSQQTEKIAMRNVNKH